MMNARTLLILWAALAAALPAAAADAPQMPVTVKQYEAAKASDRNSFPAYVVRVHNLSRVLDGQLGPAERTESLRLVMQLGADDPKTLDALGALLVDTKTPPSLRDLVTEQLLKNNRPGLSAQAIRSLAKVPPGSSLRKAILDSLAERGDISMFSEVVKAWAQEPPDGKDEARFRGVVEKMTGVQWDQALLVGMNAKSFFARGSAIKVISGRGTAASWRDKITAVKARTEAMAALKLCVLYLDYLPADGLSLLSAVTVYRTRPDYFRDVAKLKRQWQNEYRYEFNVRDFHLLGRLSTDPLRKMLRRDELIAALSASLNARSHVPRHGAPESSDLFAKQLSRLTMADLWNLYLLDEMLQRPRVLLALRVMAGRDRADRTTAWGGLVVYESGKAEARLYPPRTEAPRDDLRYMPSRRMIADGRDSMCRFLAHFEKADNTARAGPTVEELKDARLNNYYGLVITSVSEKGFCAHYFNPDGTVVSLGRMPYRF
ncbi:MAG TPA: hypothetical protein VNA25_27490 [Phycisphaerae bacterium]|nr:hypothetical protein [Phycisphaerae bacterium]HUT61601.1 hypothetical protein [Phycisphaerae bacterium]